jgi:RNA polymerase sigma-70 factor (ECF subfamily)
MDDAGVRFGLLWGEAHLAVRTYIHGLVGDPTSTDDLVQEVALAAFRSFASYDPQRSFTGWAMGVARNLVHQHWGRLNRQRAMIHDLDLVDDLTRIAIDIDDAAADRRTALRQCLATIEGRNWEIIQQHYVDGESTATIAERLRIEVGHLRVVMHRIRNALRACIERRLKAGGHA